MKNFATGSHEISLSSKIKENPMKFYQCFRESVGRPKNQRNNLRAERGNVDKIRMKYFSSVFTTKNDQAESEFRYGCMDNLVKGSIKMEEVLDVIRCIRDVKSAGPDKIYPGFQWEAR